MSEQNNQNRSRDLRVDTWSRGVRLESEVLTRGRTQLRLRQRNGDCLLEIRRKGNLYQFSRLSNDLRGKLELKKNYSVEDLASVSIRLQGREWHFAGIDTPAFDPAATQPALLRQRREENSRFLKSLGQAAAGLGMLVLISGLAHQLKLKREAEAPELIPTEVARLILKPTRKSETSGSSSRSGSGAVSARELTQAIQSKEVQSSFAKLTSQAAVSRLLKSQSRFLSQWKRETGLKPTENSALSGSELARNIAGSFAGFKGGGTAVQAFGGGTGTGTGDKAGYGNGAGSGVSGQGQGVVRLETRLAQVEQGLTADEVGEVIHRHAAEIRYCYEDALLRNPSTEGKLQLLFKISPRGVVASTEVRSSNLGDARLEDCIIRKLTTWKFPTPKGGIEVPVTYPFVFKNLEKKLSASR